MKDVRSINGHTYSTKRGIGDHYTLYTDSSPVAVLTLKKVGKKSEYSLEYLLNSKKDNIADTTIVTIALSFLNE